MRKKTASGVLASLRVSPYATEYGFAASLTAALLAAFFRILHGCSALSQTSISVTAPEVNISSASAS